MKHKLILLASPFLLVLNTGCSSDSKDSKPTDADYDAVAQSLSASLATTNGGGDVGSMSDSVDIAIGVPPLGINVQASGAFMGNRVGVNYSYALTCKDASGQALQPCGGQTDSANVKVDWDGNLTLPFFEASVERHGTWTLANIQSSTADFSGTSTFEFDGKVQGLRPGNERDYHLSYSASYDRIRLQRSPRLAIAGKVHYAIAAERKASSQRGESDASFSINADLAFDSSGSATLVLDGSHHYTVNVNSGQVTASP